MKKKDDFDKFFETQMKNPEFREEWERLEPQYQIIQAILDARNKYGLTQKDLAEITGIGQADISRLENGSANPSINTLYRLAKGLGMKLKIMFEEDRYAQHPEQKAVVAEPG